MRFPEWINRVIKSIPVSWEARCRWMTDIPVFREFIKAAHAYVYVTGRDVLQTAQSVARCAQIAVHRPDAANYTAVRQTSGYFNNQLDFTQTRWRSKRILFLLHSSVGFRLIFACRATSIKVRGHSRWQCNFTHKNFPILLRLAIASDSVCKLHHDVTAKFSRSCVQSAH